MEREDLMGQGDTVSKPAGVFRDIFPNDWEFPDPRVAALVLLVLAALFLSGRFGAEDGRAPHEYAADGSTIPDGRSHPTRGELASSRP